MQIWTMKFINSLNWYMWGPSKVEETFAVESVEGSKKGRRRIIPLGQWLPKITVDACVAPNVVLSDAGQTGQQREIQLRWSWGRGGADSGHWMYGRHVESTAAEVASGRSLLEGYVDRLSSTVSLSISSHALSFQSSGGCGSGSSESNMLLFYTDDDPGLKITPTVVLVLNLCFIGFVTVLHVFGKIYRHKSGEVAWSKISPASSLTLGHVLVFWAYFLPFWAYFLPSTWRHWLWAWWLWWV